uniref:Transient receptor ion channel domain-containing protein n=1 Tax=Romanomermis culicivorax TaxID=13658 RepID=A0A915J1H8_ROMCU
DNENVEIIELLLSHEDIKIGNALLHGIREGVYKMVEMLIDHPSITSDMLGDGWRGSLDHNDAENFEYSADISPVMLAAHLDQFEILQLLLSRGARIYKPHVAACPCDQCKEDRSSDSLQHSLKRIYTFRALASPAWISLTSNDPILTAFRLSWELQRLSRSECEFKDIYLHLSEQCKSYAVDLLSQCRSTEEVIAIMNRGNSADENQELYTPRLSLDRLKLAIKYEQKQFVSHPHCQQLLTSIWFQGFPGRRESSSMINILVTTLLIFAWPFIALIYIIYPRSKIGQMVRSPYMKFLYYSTSFSCFLLLLTLATVEDYRSNMEDDVSDNRTMNRGPPPSFVEVLIIFWVFGMLWSEMKQLWDEGFNKYLHQWWNLLDFIMIALYLCTFSLRTIAYLRFHTKYVNLANLPRQDWWSGEPMLIAESLFAIANVFSFARIIYLFQTSPYLGPLQISLGCMLIDIGKFFVIFFLILTSFAIGLVQLYWYYGKSVHCPVDASINCKKEAFSSISNSYTTLLWSLFSITKPEDTDVVEKHYFTQLAGRGMYIAYHVTSIIVLLNMLIAMMSHSFQNINDHADLEWKFHRTKLWLSYFDEGSSLPAPFNLVVSPKWMVYFTKGAVNFVKCLLFRQPLPKASRRATIKVRGFEKKQLEKGRLLY